MLFLMSEVPLELEEVQSSNPVAKTIETTAHSFVAGTKPSNDSVVSSFFAANRCETRSNG